MPTDSSLKSPTLNTTSRQAFWQRHVSQWRDSGLSKMAYCRQYSLAYHQLIYWCGKDDVGVPGEPEASTSGFVAVSVSSGSSHSGLTIRLPNGIRIEGIDSGSVELVQNLIKQL